MSTPGEGVADAAGTAAEVPTAVRRREQRGWYVYDWANSAFQTTALTVFLGPFLIGLADQASVDGRVRVLGLGLAPGAVYAYLTSLSALFQVVAMPLVAASADRTGARRSLLAVTAFTGAAATVSIALVPPDAFVAAGLLFLVATVAYACSIVVYNAWLPDIATPDERDRVSSNGWALGYLGGGLLLALNLGLFLLANAGRVPIGGETAARLSISSSGLWWALFTVVPLVVLTRGVRAAGGAAARSGPRQLLATARRLRSAPATLRFLVAYLVYNDGIQTVISQTSVYAIVALGLDQVVLVGAILLVQFVAVAGALGMGALATRVGAQPTVLASLLVWIGVLAVAFFLPAGSTALFYVLAAAIGLVLGGTQALSRSLFSHMVPDGAEAEYFAFYEISDRGTSWLGPLVFGFSLQLTDSPRVAILSLLVFFIAGGALLRGADIRRAAAEAGNTAPALV